jgi:germination protein M
MKKKIFLLFLAAFGLLLAGCGSREGGQTEENENKIYFYFLNNAENQLVAEEYVPAEATSDVNAVNPVTDVNSVVDSYLEALMTTAPANLNCKKAVPENVTIVRAGEVENEQLTLAVNQEYTRLSAAQEILCRAAIVKTLCQIDGVSYITFLIDGQPMKDSLDKPIGYMTAEDFIDNTGGETKFEQNAVVTLYFADATGTSLIETRVKIRYDGAVPIEQLVIEQLIKGPKSISGVNEEELLATLPEDTSLNKVTVRDGICYVDFSSEFLKKNSGISDEVVIYSVVNSLIEISAINKVQFTVAGSEVSSFGDGAALDISFERNFEIIQKTD